MNETEFEALAGRALETIEEGLEACGIDADFELKEGGVLEIEFPDGAKIIVNRHGAAREIWVAARSGGFHYRWDGAAWRDTRSGMELFEALSGLLSRTPARRSGSARAGSPSALPAYGGGGLLSLKKGGSGSGGRSTSGGGTASR